jgi:hypothetical protein
MLIVTMAAAPMPAMQPYRQGSVSPTEVTFIVPEKRLARVNYGGIAKVSLFSFDREGSGEGGVAPRL